MATKKNNSTSVSTDSISLDKSKVADKPAFALSDAEKLPMHFDYYEDAIEAHHELKKKVTAAKEMLVNADTALVGIMNNESYLLFTVSVPKRFDNEHQWFELVDKKGKSFGFVDSNDEETEDTFALTVQRGDEVFNMPYIELARQTGDICSARDTVSKILKYWHANADTQESFDRLVTSPALRDEALLERFDAYLVEFAKSRLKMLK